MEKEDIAICVSRESMGAFSHHQIHDDDGMVRRDRNVRVLTCMVVCGVPSLLMSQADVEAAFQRISAHKGVKGILIVDDEGRELRTTMSAELSEKYAELIPQLAGMARSAIRDIDPSVCQWHCIARIPT